MLLRNLLRRSPGNRLIAGTPHIGLLASQIIAETAAGDSGPGLLYDEALGQTGKALRIKVTNWSGTAGTLFVYENGSVHIEGQADGTYTIGYDWEAWAANGQLSTGSSTASVQIGPLNATALGATVAGSGTLIGGAATGERNATAQGATLTGAGSIVGGAADGQGNATAPGATLNGVGSLLAGAAEGEQNATTPEVTIIGSSTIDAGGATGGASGDATASGATVTGTGSITGGAASAPTFAGAISDEDIARIAAAVADAVWAKVLT